METNEETANNSLLALVRTDWEAKLRQEAAEKDRKDIRAKLEAAFVSRANELGPTEGYRFGFKTDRYEGHVAWVVQAVSESLDYSKLREVLDIETWETLCVLTPDTKKVQAAIELGVIPKEALTASLVTSVRAGYPKYTMRARAMDVARGAVQRTRKLVRPA